jgi:hypothetical protein
MFNCLEIVKSALSQHAPDHESLRGGVSPGLDLCLAGLLSELCPGSLTLSLSKNERAVLHYPLVRMM